MRKMKIDNNLLHLQNLVKRDPESYHSEFLQQYQHYKALLDIFKVSPSHYNQEIQDLTMFMAQVSSCYPDVLKDFPNDLISLLKEYLTVLDASIRLVFVRTLILLRNRGMISPIDLITFFFKILHVSDKILRKHIQVYIITDIKNLNAKHENTQVNRVIQNLMFSMITDSNKTRAKISLDIMIELYRRNVWRNSKTVNVIALGCFSKIHKILVAALHFFLSIEEQDEEEEEDSEDDIPSAKELMNANKVNKKSRKRLKMLRKTKQILKKSKKKKKEQFDFSALHLINDPQGMAEKLFNELQSSQDKYQIRLLMMNLISRLVGVHKLILLKFYFFIQRFLKPHQSEVTKILMFVAQASHEFVPPDVLEPILKLIADNFITERNSAEVITVGINAIREICARCPFAMPQDLLEDLVQYNTYKNKNVIVAAKSLIQLFRQINPKMLQRKYRSRPTESTKSLKPLEYGEIDSKSFIPGAEVLSLELTDNDNDEHLPHSDSDKEWSDIEVLEYNEKTDNKDQTTVNDRKESDSKNKNSKEEVEKAEVVSHSRIFSQDEFHKLKVAQLAKQMQYAKGQKRKVDSLNESNQITTGEIVSLQDIEKLHKKPKSDKETRLATVLEGKGDRENFGKKKKKNPFSSKSQKEHNKRKNFMMIKHKVKRKIKRSFKEKQLALRNALLKRSKKK